MALVVTTTSASVKKWRTKPKPRKIQTETTSERAQDEPVLYNPADLETMLAVRSGGYKGDSPSQHDAEVPQETRVIDGLQLQSTRRASSFSPPIHQRRNTIEYDNVHKSLTSTNADFNIKPAAENPVFHPGKQRKFHDRNGNVADIDGRFAHTAIAPAIEIAVDIKHGNKKHTSSVQWLSGPVYDHGADK
ncbi:hypothetical protein LTR97_005769 [Elasticomyces elasticus]|uniref:Uncharacterized protein n=1 Tax=Elasticomyces elasticus TaxID=574655 RepID=A0AAN7VRA5_9PEZI|nr:hypothetical protein LTR97_005769 [Elasticomyces elasticus]KAK5721702.1 hypothetical protein LTR15_006293 [Elasticomyces elasticus]